MIKLKCDDVILSDGSIVKIGTSFPSLRDIPRAIVREVYKRELSKGNSSSIAEMNTCILCGYETQNAVRKIVRVN